MNSGAMKGSHEGTKTKEPAAIYEAQPNHWVIKRLKWSTAGVFNGIWGDEPDGENDILCIRVADFDRRSNRVIEAPETLRSVEPKFLDNRKLRQGDLLIERSGGGENQLVGCVVSFDHSFDAVCSNFVARVAPAEGIHSRFFAYVHDALYSARFNFPAIKQTTGIQNLDAEAYFNTQIAFPPISEQRLIAEYLDRETARIDALVADKEKMLALLEEKRAALISRAVTRGLDPTAPLKPSGLDWLGDIPAHWEVLRLKFLVKGIDQGNSPQCYSYPAEAGQWGVLKTGCVNGGLFRETENKALPSNIDPFVVSEVQVDDILMSRASGSADLIGSVAHVSTKPAARLLLSDKIYRLRLRPEKAVPSYFVYALGADYVRHQIKAIISGAEGLANNIAKSDILEFSIITPPIGEQFETALKLTNEVSKSKSLGDLLIESIVKLKERRAALITAAVTGQISLEAMQP